MWKTSRPITGNCSTASWKAASQGPTRPAHHCRACPAAAPTLLFTPDPNRNFNRGTTDYFVNGRKEDIGAFDTPKHAGLPIGYVSKIGETSFEIETTETLYNGDAVSWFDLQKELHGCKVNVAKLVAQGKAGSASTWRIEPNEAMDTLEGLRKGVEVNRNRDMSWDRLLAKKSSDRRIGVWLALNDTPTGFTLQVTDEEGNAGQAHLSAEHQLSKIPPTPPPCRKSWGGWGTRCLRRWT